MIARVRGFVQRFLGIKFVQDTITLQAGKMVLTAISVGAGIILLRGLGKDQYGIWSTMLTMYGLLMFFNLTGIGQSTLTRLSESLSAGNCTLTLNLMAFYMQVSLGVSVIASGIAFLAGPAFAAASYDSRAVGELMAVYTLVYFPLSIYQLMLLVLQSSRSMRAYTLLENSGVVVDAVLVVGVVITQTGAAGLVVAYLISSLIKAGGVCGPTVISSAAGQGCCPPSARSWPGRAAILHARTGALGLPWQSTRIWRTSLFCCPSKS